MSSLAAKATTWLFALGAATSTFASGIFAGRLLQEIYSSVPGRFGDSLSYPVCLTFSAGNAALYFGMVGTYFPCIPIVTAHFAPSVWGRALRWTPAHH
jgi:hypothetical protein